MEFIENLPFSRYGTEVYADGGTRQNALQKNYISIQFSLKVHTKANGFGECGTATVSGQVPNGVLPPNKKVAEDPVQRTHTPRSVPCAPTMAAWRWTMRRRRRWTHQITRAEAIPGKGVVRISRIKVGNVTFKSLKLNFQKSDALRGGFVLKAYGIPQKRRRSLSERSLAMKRSWN